jgi:hypothetical protein
VRFSKRRDCWRLHQPAAESDGLGIDETGSIGTPWQQRMAVEAGTYLGGLQYVLAEQGAAMSVLASHELP